nr:DapH/DapD/GlmU-related protein [uncultured Acetatifactor sp.]
MNMLKKIKHVFISIYVICIIKPIAYLVYEKKYLTGKYFQNACDVGWRWVMKGLFFQKVLGFNRDVPWPVSCRCSVGFPQNIFFHPDDLNNFQGIGIYVQGYGRTFIGHGTWIGPHVGLITANHNIDDLDSHCTPKGIEIGKKCWIGMNSVILPGVTLGNKTIVGAGAVVTKSFPKGNCIIAGNPARIIKELR